MDICPAGHHSVGSPVPLGHGGLHPSRVWWAALLSRETEKPCYTGFERLTSNPLHMGVQIHHTPRRPYAHSGVCTVTRAPWVQGWDARIRGCRYMQERGLRGRNHAGERGTLMGLVWWPCRNYECPAAQPRRQDTTSCWWPGSWWWARSPRSPRGLSAGTASSCQPQPRSENGASGGQGQTEGEDRCREGRSLGRGWAREHEDPQLRRRSRGRSSTASGESAAGQEREPRGE